MARVVRNCEFDIENTNNGTNINRIIKDVQDSAQAYNKVRDQICDDKKISIREFENRYKVKDKKTYVRFADKPWSDGDELKKGIKNIKSVQDAFYVPPLRGRYGPPKFRIRTDSDTKTLREDVNNYYDGLVVEQRNGTNFVIVSPTEFMS
jgi:hypothetical protein